MFSKEGQEDDGLVITLGGLLVCCVIIIVLLIYYIKQKRSNQSKGELKKFNYLPHNLRLVHELLLKVIDVENTDPKIKILCVRDCKIPTTKHDCGSTMLKLYYSPVETWKFFRVDR